MKNTKYYVYTHTRDIPNSMPFYVGKGNGKRAWKTQGRNRYHKNIIAKNKFLIKIVGILNTEEEAFRLEKALISFYRTLGFAEANITNGGEGASGLKQSEITRQKAREFFLNPKNNPRTGKHWSKTERERIGRQSKERLKRPEDNPMWGKRGPLNPNHGKPRPNQSKALLGRTGRNACNFQGLWHCGEFGVFESSRLAGKRLTVSHNTIVYRVNSKSDKWKSWFFQKSTK